MEDYKFSGHFPWHTALHKSVYDNLHQSRFTTTAYTRDGDNLLATYREVAIRKEW